jgi:hypothetical protein
MNNKIETESNLVKHAKKELQIAGLFDKNSDYNGMLGKAVMELINVFSNQGHSGSSASMVNRIFSQLASYQTITPLTGKDDEWNLVSNIGGNACYQNNRNSALFKDNKDGQAYYINAILWKTQKGITWHGITSSEISSNQYIKSFPFQPVTFYIDVTEEEIKKDDWVFHINNEKDLDKVWEVYDLKRINKK